MSEVDHNEYVLGIDVGGTFTDCVALGVGDVSLRDFVVTTLSCVGLSKSQRSWIQQFQAMDRVFSYPVVKEIRSDRPAPGAPPRAMRVWATQRQLVQASLLRRPEPDRADRRRS